MRFLFLTMDGNHKAALRDAAHMLRIEHGIDLQLSIYDATSLRGQEARLAEDVARSDFVFGSMLFGEGLVRPLQRVLEATNTPTCIITSNPALIRCTRIGGFVLAKPDNEPGMLKRWLKKFHPKGGKGEGRRQLALMRNLGSILKFIPGTAQDVHTYIAAHDYWLHASPENIYRLLCLLIDRYTPGYNLPIEEPIHYPDIAIYHPDAPHPFPDVTAYRKWRNGRVWQGSVGLLSLRTVILSGNTQHLDALIRTVEERGIEVRAAYSAGLDFRPALEQFYTGADGATSVDVLLNGAGFSLVGGMAESRPEDARIALEALDVGYLDMIPLAFQRVEEWQRNDIGLSPIQLAMNVAIPELDGATEPLVFGGPTEGSDTFVPLQPQVELAADRIARRAVLRRKANAQKKIAVVLFNFPPNLGNIGTAAYLDVFQSLHRLMGKLRDEGYTIDVPPTPEDLRTGLVEGNAMMYGTDGNVGARLPLDDYRELFPHYMDIEPMWGHAPGELLTDGRDFYVLGKQFGNVFVGLQPSFGYERDPMRLLMAKDASPHHGFAAFYTWLEHIFGADAVLHFGTHGALEFMPGKQAGMSTDCWPTRLLGSLPNFYYYSVNNPSEASIAKRRGAATLISYMVPPLQQAGLYKGLRRLKDNIDNYRQRPTPELLADIRTMAKGLGITPETDDKNYLAALSHELIQVEHRMIPLGLHVLGQPPSDDELVDILTLVATFTRLPGLPPLPELVAAGLGWDYDSLRHALEHEGEAQARWEHVEAICHKAMRQFVAGTNPDAYLHREAGITLSLDALWAHLDDLRERIVAEEELAALLHGLEGGYIAPSPGNDVVRNEAVVPTGRNIHGLDPFRVPTPAAETAGEELVHHMLGRLTKQQGGLPETIAMVLWGTDNLKSECEGVAQTLALLGARAVTDELGNVADVELIPLEKLGRPRIDVVVTVSGIFRDLLHHQMNLIDKAVKLAAHAPEPEEWNFVRKHTAAHAERLGCEFNEAATRVFSNEPGHYGANVNHLVESSNWEDDDELSDAFVSRKCFTIGEHGQWHDARAVMESAMGTVDAAFQNIDSFEIGISDVDHYYEYLGGVAKTVEKARGVRPPVLVADAISINGRLSSLEKMIRLETRAKLLNPKWYEAMLNHGYEGVSEIETRVGNTYGWSATADAVEGWVYDDIAGTYLLDEAMRQRLSTANPHATAGIARRLLEAEARGHWQADEATIERLRAIYGDLEDRMEAVK